MRPPPTLYTKICFWWYPHPPPKAYVLYGWPLRGNAGASHGLIAVFKLPGNPKRANYYAIVYSLALVRNLSTYMAVFTKSVQKGLNAFIINTCE